jgi:hypothetical protein
VQRKKKAKFLESAVKMGKPLTTQQPRGKPLANQQSMASRLPINNPWQAACKSGKPSGKIRRSESIGLLSPLTQVNIVTLMQFDLG